jgi:mono/diheme cytochrome c family protein
MNGDRKSNQVRIKNGGFGEMNGPSSSKRSSATGIGFSETLQKSSLAVTVFVSAAAITGLVVLSSGLFTSDRGPASSTISPGTALIGTAYAQAPSKAQIKKGKDLFVENCEVCHQADAIGKPGVAPSLTNPELLAISSDKFLMATIRDGREDTGMPPFSHLGRSQVQSIVAFLRSHQTLPSRAKEVDSQPDAHGDPRLGQQWYNNICSTCHGVAGDGYEAGGTGTAIGLPGFLNKVTDGFIRETIKTGRSNTRMLGFQGPAAMANLSDQEIDDIIVYLRGLAKQ